MPWFKRRPSRRRRWGFAAATGAALLSLVGAIATVIQLIASAGGMQMFPPLAVAVAALAVSGGALLLALGHERPAGVVFLVAMAVLAFEEIVGLTYWANETLPASPLESVTFAVVAGAGAVASVCQRRWPTARVGNLVARGFVLWALAIAGVGLAGRTNLLTPEVDGAVDSSATWWGWATAILVGLCLLSATDRGVRVSSPRDRLKHQFLLAGWIVGAPVVSAIVVDLFVANAEPASARAMAGWMTLLLCAAAALAAASLDWIAVDLQLANVRNASADGTIVVDRSSKIVYADDSACQLFGWPRDELVGRPLDVIIPARFRTSHQHRTDDYLKQPEHRSMGLAATVGLRHDGSEFEAEVVLAPVAGGQLVSAAIWEVKGMRLKRRETRFRDRLVAVIEQSSQGFFIESAAGIAMEANDALCRMLGFSREELLGTSIVNRCIPEELATVDRAVLTMIEEGGDHAEWRARYSRKGGSFWADVEVTRLVDDQGRIQGVAGQMRDVSVEVAEREHRLAAEGLLVAATEASPIGLAVTTLDGMHQQVNPAYCEMTGYSDVELHVRTVKSITDPEDWLIEEKCRRRLLVAASDGGAPSTQALDKRCVRSDGSESWVRLHLSLLRAADGTATAFVSQTFDVSEEKRAGAAARVAQAELTFRASHDSLTGVRNRSNIIDVLTRLLVASKAGNVGLLFLDLDRFKQINDDISHTAGDQVLVEVANRLRSAIRANDCIGRIGGDEFIVVLGDLTAPADAAAVAEHIRGSISATEFTADGIKLGLTASMGIAVSRPGQTAAELLRDADAALQVAKESGRDRSRLNDDDLKTNVARRKEIAKALQRAIASGEIQAWFQPIVDLADRHVVGMEAVAHWLEPGAAPMPATELIEIAQQSDLTNDLGMNVIGQALAHLAALPETITMAVSVAPVQLTRTSLSAGITSLLNSLQLNPERFVIEVAEASLLALRPKAVRDLEAMVSSGVKLHVGGFGTSDSSLSVLRDFPVSGVKLDRSVVRHLGADPAHPMAKLASGLGSLAREFGLTRIADGIETEGQAQAARHAGWTLGQGRLFGEAEPSPELVSALLDPNNGPEHVIHNRRRADGSGTIFAQASRRGAQ